MDIIVTHLTRMAAGYICVAGNDLQTMRHIRPVLSGTRIESRFLTQNGGIFEVGGIVDLGRVRAKPSPPELEDHRFFMTVAKRIGKLSTPDLWQLIHPYAHTSFRAIFGEDLVHNGRSCSVELGKGSASLGFLLPHEVPTLYVRDGRIRLRVTDGEIDCFLSVTDTRLYQESSIDGWTPDTEICERVRNHLQQRSPVILSVGLTRPRAYKGSRPQHWLQVNNIHLQDPAIFANL